MRKKSWVTLAGMLIYASVLQAQSETPKSIEWRSDYDTARKEAAEKDRPLFLDFITESCFHCRRLESGPFRDSAIVKLLNERFIPLKIDAAKSPKLTEALKIQAYPTMIIASNDGKIIGFLEGFMETKSLHEHLQRCLAVQTPDWMARDFQEASKAVGNGDYAKAVTLLKSIIEDGKERPVQAKAKQVMQEIEQQAANRLVRARQLQDKEQYREAMDLVTEVISRYSGTQTAKDGTQLFAKLAEHPEILKTQRTRRANDLLAQAKEAFKVDKYHEALDLCEILETTYKDLPEGKQGNLLASEIRSSPEKLAKACDNLNERLATMYATLGETWIKKGDRDQASICFEKAVRAAPASLIARDAQAKLVSLQSKPPAIPTKYVKPEKEEKE